MIFYLYLKEEFPIWFNFFKEVFTEEIASKYAKYFVKHRMSFEKLRNLKMDYLEIMGINIGDCITILNHPKVKGKVSLLYLLYFILHTAKYIEFQNKIII